MLNEQMYILWQQIKYFANTYTNICYLGFSFAHLFTFTTFFFLYIIYKRSYLDKKHWVLMQVHNNFQTFNLIGKLQESPVSSIMTIDT